MPISPANASELATIAREVGADKQRIQKDAADGDPDRPAFADHFGAHQHQQVGDYGDVGPPYPN